MRRKRQVPGQVSTRCLVWMTLLAVDCAGGQQDLPGAASGGDTNGAPTIAAAGANAQSASTGGANNGLGGNAQSTSIGGTGSARGGSGGATGSNGGSATGGTEVGTGGGNATGGVSGGASGQTSTLTDATKGRLRAIQARAVALQNAIVGFWKKYGPDKTYGGFYGTLDRAGTSINPTNKFVHQQARHLWAFSAWYRHKEATPEVKAIADDLASFMAHFRDTTDNQYFYAVSRDGLSVSDRKKMLYAQSFSILGLSEYSLAFNVKSACDDALETFRSVDAAMHDTSNGGYDQTNDPWTFNVTGAKKSMNVHMHLLESLTNLYRCSGDSTVKQRVTELVDVFVKKIAQPQTYLHTDFSLTWVPMRSPTVVEYGHDLQTFWLMLGSLDALGRPREKAVLDVMLPIAEQSSLRGIDPNGGYQMTGTPGGQARAGNKIWWVQAEALNGLFQLHLVTGNAVHLDRLDSTLDFVEAHQVDATNGEWYAELNSSYAPTETRKGYEWKASYHTLRVAVQLDIWTGQLFTN